MTTPRKTACELRVCERYYGPIGPPDLPTFVCDAYPLGIPDDILDGFDLHTKSIGNDDGIVYKGVHKDSIPLEFVILKGSDKSGHRGHKGRPGKRGGSLPGTGGGPVHASLSKDGKYEERPTEGGLHYILAATSHTWDETAIHPDKFSPDAEIQLMKDANAHMRGLLSDPEMADFIKRIDRDGDALISHGSDDKYTIGTNIIFTGDPSMAGVGSGGPGSSKIFWVPYSADEEAFSKAFRGDTQSQSAFGVDPLYVAFHEMHHAYGSNTELDMFSDFAALDFHLSRGNTTQMKAAVDAKLDSMFMWASGQASGEWKQDRLDTRAALGRLYSRNPAATEDWVANSWFGGNDDSRTKMLARLRSWRNS